MRGNSTISNRCRCHRTAAVDHRTSCRWRPPYALITQIDNKKEKELSRWTEELKENQPDIFDDMTEEEIIEFLQLETHPLIEWYGKEYIEERMLFIDYLIKSDDAKNKEVSAFIEERTKKQKEEENEFLEWVNLLKSTC